MLITLLAALFAALALLLVPFSVVVPALYLIVLLLIGAILLFAAALYLNVHLLPPLQRLEGELLPGLMSLFYKDVPLRLTRLYLFGFSFLSFLGAFLLAQFHDLSHPFFFWGWLILLACAFDLIKDSWKRSVHLLTPAFVVNHTFYLSERAIQNADSQELFRQLDNLSEMALKCVEKDKLALEMQILQRFAQLLKIYFDSAKSISHLSQDIEERKKQSGLVKGDSANFIVFYLIQRLEMIYDKALNRRQETTCRQLVMSLGKIIVHSAQFDLSMMAFPTHFLTKFGLKAEQHAFDEIAVLTTSTLLEVSQTVINSVELAYTELEEPFCSVITGLSALAKSSFKKHKPSRIQALVQPLLDLKALFLSDKLKNHPDTPLLLRKIDDVLEEFTALEQVMLTLPSLGGET